MGDIPGVSIITVVRNGETVIGRTLDSIAALRWPRVQHVIIDGGSEDGTMAVIRQRASRVGYLVSEADKGIYDAMNKGLAAAGEEYGWFVNAGDTVYDPTVLERAFSGGMRPDLFYGNTMLVQPDGTEAGLRRGGVPRELKWESFRFGMVVCHQAMIVRRTVASPFDLRWRHVADIQWAIDVLKRARESVFVEGPPLCRFLTGGHSDRHRMVSLWERFRLLEKNFGLLPNLGSHFLITARWLVRRATGRRKTGTPAASAQEKTRSRVS